MNTVEDKHRHHTLPRLYLKGFAESEDRPFVWVYNKGAPFRPGGNKNKNNPARTSIRSASVVLDAYGYSRRDGTFDPNTYENTLEKLEKPSDSILKKIRAGRLPDPQEKWTLTSYIFLTYKRVPRREERVREGWADFVANAPSIQYYRSPEFLSRLVPERRLEVEQVLAEYEKEPSKEFLLKTMVMEWGEAPLYLATMAWRFLVARGNSRFVTGDDPVFTSGLGLKKIAAELTFPISTDITLHASWQPGQERFIDAPESYVRQLNQRTASNCTQLFYYRSEEWVAKIFNRGGYGTFLLDVSGSLRTLWMYRDEEVVLASNPPDE